YCELDQLAGTLALDDPQAGRFLPQTTAYWFQYFVDHQYGDVWNGVTFGTNAPQRDMPKALGVEERLSRFRTRAGRIHVESPSPIARLFTRAFSGRPQSSLLRRIN